MTEVNLFAIASVETKQLQSEKRMALKSSAQSSEASSLKQRASGRELSLCLLSPNSTNSERNICSIRKQDWQTTVKLVVGTFQVPLSTTTTTKTDLENEPSKTSQQSIIAMFSKSHFHSHQLSPQFPGRSCVPLSPIDSLHINRFVSTSKRPHSQYEESRIKFTQSQWMPCDTVWWCWNPGTAMGWGGGGSKVSLGKSDQTFPLTTDWCPYPSL